MKTKTIIILVLIAAAIIAVLYWVRSCKADQPDVIAIADSTQYYKNKLGQEVAAMKQREQDYHKVAEGYLDSIAGLHNTSQKYIRQISELKLRGQVVISVPGDPIVKRDTIPGECPTVDWVEQEFKNPWYVASVRIPLNGDSSSLSLETFDTIRTVDKIVKEGNIFNRREYLQVDAVNTNPYNRITGMQLYRKPLPKQKRFGIGLQTGYGITTQLKPTVYVGAGISYNIIRL